MLRKVDDALQFMVLALIIRLHRMHEMQTIAADMRGVCLSVCLSVCHAAQLGFTMRGSFGAAFAKSLWPLVEHALHSQ